MEALSVSYSLALFILWSNLFLYSMQNPPAHTQGTPSPGPHPTFTTLTPTFSPSQDQSAAPGGTELSLLLPPPTLEPSPPSQQICDCTHLTSLEWGQVTQTISDGDIYTAGQPYSVSGQISKLCWLVPLKVLETQFCFSIGFIWELENLWAWLRLTGHLKAMSHMDGNNKWLINNSSF